MIDKPQIYIKAFVNASYISVFHKNVVVQMLNACLRINRIF